MYALRDAMRVLVEERRQLQVLLADSVRGWMEQLREAQGRESEDDFGVEPGDDEERSEALFRLAMEHAWLLDGDADEDEGDGLALEPEPELEQSGAPLACSRPTRASPGRSRARRASGWALSSTASGRSLTPSRVRACG